MGIIPARWASTRLPGKPLTPLCGVPLVVWTARRAAQARTLDSLCVAVDDERIQKAVEAAGFKAVMTASDHPSGTDRIAEAAASLDADIVVNVQGDEPLMDPALIDRLVDALSDADDWDMATAVCPLADPADIQNPSVVKAVTAQDGRALYFSRAPIPYRRDPEDPAPAYVRHIGIYAYRRAFLETLVRTPPCAMEQNEKLEQLRALYIGGRIRVLETDDVGIGVDTPEDVSKAEAALRRAGLSP